MKIRIESDGLPRNTKVVHEDGTEIRGISRINLTMDCETSIAALEFCIPAVAAVAEARISQHHLAELAAALGYELVKIESN